MFRRPRFSARPNVGPPGKAPQEAAPAPPEAGAVAKDAAAAVTDPQTPLASGGGDEPHGDAPGAAAALQRRKRFSMKPKVAPGRPPAAARVPRSQAVPEPPAAAPDSAPPRLRSPRRWRPSEDAVRPGASPAPTGGSEPPPASSGIGEELESASKEAPPPGPPAAAVLLSLPDREAVALAEKARTLVASRRAATPPPPPPAFSLSRLLNDPSDLQRIAKAQKLRELLKREKHKEKRLKKGNPRAQEFNLDPAKMTMSDLIRYLPLSNPMTSSLEESAQENETAASPRREASPERAPTPVVLPKIGSPREEEEEEEEEEDSSMVPQVKVAEDGTLIIDEESLTVEVLRAKGPNPAQDRDPIFERGSTTTYSSFRKGTYTKPWSNEETDMFFLAISMVGTDFSMICQLFSLRTRREIKNKFKKEERENSWRVDKAFQERRKLDIEYFSKLLEKILEVHKNRKKLRSLAARIASMTERRAKAGKKAARKPSAAAKEEDGKEEKEIADLEEEGEKENEDLCNEGAAAAKPKKKKRKRKNGDGAAAEEPDDKRTKTAGKSKKKDEADVPGDAEAALPGDGPTPDVSDRTEGANEEVKIKPAKLSRAKGPKPLLPLGRKWAKKPPPAATRTNDTPEQSAVAGEAEDQVNRDASPVRQAQGKKSPTEDSEEEEEETALQPQKPTRSGRVPKPVQLLNYPAREASPEGSPGSASRPKAKCTAKRGRPAKPPLAQESKKPKLVTLRASRSEYSDEEDEEQRGGGEDVEEEEHPAWGSSNDGTAPVFVPVSLRSPRPVIPEVEEMMEELDILANIPDVLGISQDALLPDATAEPCEHQLDLLVDVIDLLSSDPVEVSENEAAHTLLTIGSLGHAPPSARSPRDAPGAAGQTPGAASSPAERLHSKRMISMFLLAGTTPADENETVPPDEIASPPDRAATETPEAVPDAVVSLVESMEPEESRADGTPEGAESGDGEPTGETGEEEEEEEEAPAARSLGSEAPERDSDPPPEPRVHQDTREAPPPRRRPDASAPIPPAAGGTTETGGRVEPGRRVLEAQVTPGRERAARGPASCSGGRLTSDPGVTESLPGGPEAGPAPGGGVFSPRRRVQKVKPKPNLPQTSRSARSKPAPRRTESPCSRTSRARPACSAAPPSPIESTGAASGSEPPAEDRSAAVGPDSKVSEPVPPRRQRLGSPEAAALQTNVVSKEPEPEPQEPAESEVASREMTPPPADLAILKYWGASDWPLNTDVVLEDVSATNTTGTDQVEAGPASQWLRDPSAGATGSSARPTAGPSAAPDVTAGSRERTRSSLLEAACEAPGPDAAQQGSDSSQNQSDPSEPADPSEPTDSPSRKAPQARRGRLVRPKPRLVLSSRAQRAEPAGAARSEAAVVSGRPDIPDPPEGATSQRRDPSSASAGGARTLPDDEPFFILSLTEIPSCSPSRPELLPRPPGPAASRQSPGGEAPPPPAEGSGESDPVRVPEPAACSTQPGRLLENREEPPARRSNETEPARRGPPLVLSLTESPGGPEPLGPGQSAPPPPPPVEESGESDPVWVPEPAACSTPPGRLQNREERRGGAARLSSANEPETTKRRRAGTTLVAVGTGSIPIPTQPEASGPGARAAQARATRSQNRKPKGAASKGPEARTTCAAAPKGPEARTTRAAAPKGPEVRTTRAAAPKGPEARTTRAAAGRLTPTATSTPTPRAPNTPRPAEAPASQRSDSREEEDTSRREEPASREEEPTNVSQYFLCDIFTEVEEG
ncbi:nascent polypeptide-associated complex subunit alpha, muscle-specific form-like isoform X2 [Pseudoliparis swirei]|uniref:nascent polypeptide-associated complex subunit alpha, muscle-specific form-like isoform X2 n=1 Tax=Pseudoliparis swirei TaxID=2059687 RepID=UPI0024BE08AB|nr:nascent polypeptide-associated complex subunit alpha, muscle-specific form-like isoform X2 [Pseudoliparis swirei]